MDKFFKNARIINWFDLLEHNTTLTNEFQKSVEFDQQILYQKKEYQRYVHYKRNNCSMMRIFDLIVWITLLSLQLACFEYRKSEISNFQSLSTQSWISLIYIPLILYNINPHFSQVKVAVMVSILYRLSMFIPIIQISISLSKRDAYSCSSDTMLTLIHFILLSILAIFVLLYIVHKGTAFCNTLIFLDYFCLIILICIIIYTQNFINDYVNCKGKHFKIEHKWCYERLIVPLVLFGLSTLPVLKLLFKQLSFGILLEYINTKEFMNMQILHQVNLTWISISKAKLISLLVLILGATGPYFALYYVENASTLMGK
jgi:hypothetical protein